MNKTLIYRLQNDVREMESKAQRCMTDSESDSLKERIKYTSENIRRLIAIQLDDLVDEVKNIEQLRNLEMDLVRLECKSDDLESEQ